MASQIQQPAPFELFVMPAPRDSSHEEVCEDGYTLNIALYTGRVRIERQNLLVYEGDIRPGMMRLQAPGNTIKITHLSHSKTLVIKLPILNLIEIISELSLSADDIESDALRKVAEPTPQATAIIQALLRSDAIRHEQRQLFLKGLIQSLLAIHFQARSVGGAQMDRITRDRLSDIQLQLCENYADKHLTEGVDLQEWAAALDLPINQFSRRFRMTTNASPYAWFMERRIARAQDMLLEGEIPMVEVALDLGFCSQSHFTKAFRDRVGMSPARWRSGQDLAT